MSMLLFVGVLGVREVEGCQKKAREIKGCQRVPKGAKEGHLALLDQTPGFPAFAPKRAKEGHSHIPPPNYTKYHIHHPRTARKRSRSGGPSLPIVRMSRHPPAPKVRFSGLPIAASD